MLKSNQQKAKELSEAFPFSMSVCEQVLDNCQGDENNAINELLMMNMPREEGNDKNSTVDSNKNFLDAKAREIEERRRIRKQSTSIKEREEQLKEEEQKLFLLNSQLIIMEEETMADEIREKEEELELERMARIRKEEEDRWKREYAAANSNEEIDNERESKRKEMLGVELRKRTMYELEREKRKTTEEEMLKLKLERERLLKQVELMHELIEEEKRKSQMMAIMEAKKEAEMNKIREKEQRRFEEERRKRLIEEDLRKQREEELRKHRKETRRRIKAEEARREKEEEQRRLRKEEEEKRQREERLRKREEERKRKEEEKKQKEYQRIKEMEEKERKQKEMEENERILKEMEEKERKQKEIEENERRQKEIEEKERKQKEIEENERKQKEMEENERKQKEISIDEFEKPEDEDVLKDFGIIQSSPEQFFHTGEQQALFTIYIQSLQQYQNIQSIKDILNQLETDNKDIRVVNVSNDVELMEFLKGQCNGNLTTPFVFVGKEPVGTLEELSVAFNNGELKKKIVNYKSMPNSLEKRYDSSSSQMSMLDRTLEGVETVASYLNPLSWVRWGIGGNTVNTNEKFKEFDIIHTNWYWRQLRRKFRFGDSHFYRLHPKWSEPRATYSYTDVSKITISDANRMILSYKTDTSPDWISCNSEDLKQIVNIIRTNAPNVIIEDFAPKP